MAADQENVRKLKEKITEAAGPFSKTSRVYIATQNIVAAKGKTRVDIAKTIETAVERVAVALDEQGQKSETATIESHKTQELLIEEIEKMRIFPNARRARRTREEGQDHGI